MHARRNLRLRFPTHPSRPLPRSADLSPADLQRIERAVRDIASKPRRKGEHPEVTIRFRERDVEISTATHHTHSRASYASHEK